MTFKYKNYEIKRLDEHNFTLHRYDKVVAKSDQKVKGRLVRTKGTPYTQETFKGFHATLSWAMQRIVDDVLGSGCADLQDVIKQIEELKEGLNHV